MIGTYRSWHTDAGIRPGSVLRKPPATAGVSSSIPFRRSAIALTEPEDAQMTGMTRSLDRRLLALNLKPALAASTQQPPALKVA